MSSSSDEQVVLEDYDPLFAFCDDAVEDSDALFDLPGLADQAVANLHSMAPPSNDTGAAPLRSGMAPSRLGRVT
eukprot:5669584-Pleurochrysis_carterae.AAC.2